LYKYENRINKPHGDRSAIAASFRHSTYRKMKLDKATLHFLDTIIPLYCGRKRPGDIYDLGESALEHRTQGLWLDPEHCEGPIPEDLVSELKQVLDRKLPMQALLEDAKKKDRLTKIKMPARGLFYNYHHWFLAQPDQGQHAQRPEKSRDSIRYDPADISTISIWDEDVWKDDLEAKELRLPDGSLKQTSEWEVKMAKALANKHDGCREDWLSYLNDAEELEKKRKAERDRIRRQRKRLAQEEQGEDERTKIEENVEDIPSDDDEYLTKLLADFQSRGKKPHEKERFVL
jgi:hypothetical protein